MEKDLTKELKRRHRMTVATIRALVKERAGDAKQSGNRAAVHYLKDLGTDLVASLKSQIRVLT